MNEATSSLTRAGPKGAKAWPKQFDGFGVFDRIGQLLALKIFEK
jgi:hypothetical protein